MNCMKTPSHCRPPISWDTTEQDSGKALIKSYRTTTNIIKSWKMRPRTTRFIPTRTAANGVWHHDQFGFFAVGVCSVLGCDRSRTDSAFDDERHTYSFSLKIRPDLRVFFIADPADFF